MKPVLIFLMLLAPVSVIADPVPPPATTPAKKIVDPTPTPVGESLELSGPTTVEVGRQCVITAKTNAKKVTWKIPPGADVLALDGKRIAVWAAPGTYTFTGLIPSGDDVVSSEVVLVVTGPRPPPPPADQLLKKVQAAYTADQSPTKVEDKIKLLAVFSVLAEDPLTDPPVGTEGKLFDFIHNSITSRIGTRLTSTRELLGEELNGVLTRKSNAVLTQKNRDDVKAQFERFVKILGEIK